MNWFWETEEESPKEEGQGNMDASMMETADEARMGWGQVIGHLCPMEEEDALNFEPDSQKSKQVPKKKKKRIDFCFDSGASRTILRPEDVDASKIVKTQDTGKNFRAANGGLIPNLGAVQIEGIAENDEKVSVVAQVAKVTKPLASAIEMVNAGNVVVLTKRGGMVKKMTDEEVKKMEDWMKKGKGSSIPIHLQGNQFTISMDVEVNACDEEEDFSDWQLSKKTCKPCAGMKCSECGPKHGFVKMPYFAPLASGF